MRTDLREARDRLYRLAESQAGLFTARQALAAGFSYRLQHYYRARREWDAIDRGIFRLRHFPDGPHAHLALWSLWSHNRHGEPQLVLSHESALAFHELGDFDPAKIHFIAPPSFKKVTPPPCVIHPGTLERAEIEEHQGFRVTTPMRSLLDGVHAYLEPERTGRAIRNALAKGMIRRADLESRLTPEEADLYLADLRRLEAAGVEALL